MSKIVVRCGEEWLKAGNLKALREFTKLGYSEIIRRIESAEPVAELILFLNNHDEIEKLLILFMNDAEERALPYEIYELNETENFSSVSEPQKYRVSSQLLRNVLQSHEETRRQIEREDELRFGSR